MEPSTHDERQDRINKLKAIQDTGVIAFADKFDRSDLLAAAKQQAEGTRVRVCGRIVFLRNMGKLAFIKLQDFSGQLQIVAKADVLNEEFDKLVDMIHVGDFIGAEGNIFTTQKGEISVLVEKFSFLSKSLRPLPEKWHGLTDTETVYRKRYLDLISNTETMDRFKFRSDFLRELRNFYNKYNFVEVDTPVLQTSASGALAKPFITHYNALDMDVYLRIAPEIYLKEAIVGGFDRVFEVARVFRNEGMDASHLQEFTMIEHYASYWDYEDNMKFTEEMFVEVVSKLKGSMTIECMNRDGEMVSVDLTPPWDRKTFRDLLIEDCGIDIDLYPETETLKAAIQKLGIQLKDIDTLGRGNMIDSLYKKVSRPKLVKPTFLTHHPIDISPLARKNDDNPLVTDRFQLVLNGWEIVNAYSELVDPIDQAERFAKQGEYREGGDEEAMQKDDEYVEAMEHGMPPMSGWGMGVERVVALLTNQPNLRDVILFPLLKPKA
ncbi:MAG: lysine--tRNA ligase [Patescibacteria group bacterium]